MKNNFGHYFTPIKDRVQVIPLEINWFTYLKQYPVTSQTQRRENHEKRKNV